MIILFWDPAGASATDESDSPTIAGTANDHHRPGAPARGSFRSQLPGGVRSVVIVGARGS